MKITKQVVEFLLTINGREEQGSFDGHVFTLKGVTGGQLTRLGAAIEREFGANHVGESEDAPVAALVKTRGKVIGVRIVEGPLTQLDERALTDASPGEIVTLNDGRRIEIQADGSAVVRRETIEASPTAYQLAKQRSDAAHEGYLRREEEKYAAAAQREATEAAAAEQARKKVEAERASEADARARREAERQRQDQEAADRKAADDANFRREREAAARELTEEQKRRDEASARVKAQHEENLRMLAEEQEAKAREEKARAEQTAREVAEGKARTAKLLAEQAERDRTEARAKEKADLDANMAKAASEDAARKQRDEAEKAAAKPALHVVPAPAPSEPKGAAVAPNGLPVPPPPAEILLPTIRFGNCVVAAHALGFRTLDDLYFVLLTVWKPNVPAIRAISGTAEELRGRIANNCNLKKLALDGGPAQVDDSDDE